ncbi:MAG: hypothetical protein AAFN12_13455, partial [Cyanobacteria bacterium J06560_2]
GGWPCRNYPTDWIARGQALLTQYAQQRQQHSRCNRPDKAKDSFAQLRRYLLQCICAPQSLTGLDVGRIRLILARYVNKRGVPSSTQCQLFRQRQQAQASGTPFHEIAQVVAARLSQYPKNEGLDRVEPVLASITEAESKRWSMPVDVGVPLTLRRKVNRCLRGSMSALVARGVVTSAETIARLLPQITGEIKAAAVNEPSLRLLYTAIYSAFRRRRSLLLLNFEKQVQLEELPWLAVVNRFRGRSLGARALAQTTLEETTQMTLAAFPHTIIPNKLLQEMHALSQSAKLNLPLSEELAADIFMGSFSAKFVQAAIQSASVLSGTLYERYYAIDYEKVRSLNRPVNSRTVRSRFPFARDQQRFDTAAFSALCQSRSGVSYGQYSTAINGMIIEQQQILTTHNLAALCSTPAMASWLSSNALSLAKQCFGWVCWRLQHPVPIWHAGLIQLKKAAYSWRQMVFFLSMLSAAQVDDFMAWVNSRISAQPSTFQQRLSPVMRGLQLAIPTQPLTQRQALELEACRFLGWSKNRHWLMEDATA